MRRKCLAATLLLALLWVCALVGWAHVGDATHQVEPPVLLEGTSVTLHCDRMWTHASQDPDLMVRKQRIYLACQARATTSVRAAADVWLCVQGAKLARRCKGATGIAQAPWHKGTTDIAL